MFIECFFRFVRFVFAQPYVFQNRDWLDRFLNLFSARGMMDLGKAISKPFLKRLSVNKLKIAKSACDNP